MKTILAPVDFSPVSQNAALYAAHLAAQLNYNLHLLHVIQLPMVYGDIPMPVGNYEDLVGEAKIELAKFARQLDEELMGQVVIHEEVKVGSPLHEILENVKRHHPFVVVLGTRGLSQIDRFLLGSVTLAATKTCECPVLVIPENFKYKHVKRIGLASDFREVVEQTPDAPIKNWVDALDAELLIIHNNPHYDEYEPEVMEEALMLDTMFTRQRHSFHFLHSGYTEESILNFATIKLLDLLIVVPKQHGFFDTLFGHQHTRDFVLHSTIPVMIIRNKREN